MRARPSCELFAWPTLQPNPEPSIAIPKANPRWAAALNCARFLRSSDGSWRGYTLLGNCVQTGSTHISKSLPARGIAGDRTAIVLSPLHWPKSHPCGLKPSDKITRNCPNRPLSRTSQASKPELVIPGLTCACWDCRPGEAPCLLHAQYWAHASDITPMKPPQSANSRPG